MRRLFVFSLCVVVVLGLVAACSQTPSPRHASNLTVETYSGEWQQSGEIRIAHFSDASITYEIIDGLAIYEGDIVLGKASDLESLASQGFSAQSIGIKNSLTNHAYLWESRDVPYRLSSNLSATTKAFIKDAIKHWEEKVPIHFVPWIGQANYVYFVPSSGCSSPVGWRGGEQKINLSEGCGFGATVHEIGHTLGFWHEQSRCDRNTYVSILYENIESGQAHNFAKQCTNGLKIGKYDLNSIMHYPYYAFAIDQTSCLSGDLTKCTILPKNGVDPRRIGQRNGLSRGDINGFLVRYRSTFPCSGSNCTYHRGLISSETTFGGVVPVSDGPLEGWLEGPTGTDFDLYVQIFLENTWYTIDESTGTTSKEEVWFSDSLGLPYRFLVKAKNAGSAGVFHLWTNPPGQPQ
jgi:hypothetical protein